MSWKFNPPPGWPAQPEGWVPPPGWVPDPTWPPPPAGWQFWVPAGAAAASAPPAAAPPPAAPPPASGGPGFSGGPPPPFASAAPPFASGPPSSGPATPFAAAGAPPYGAAPKRTRPWFGQWWGIVGLIAMLLLGAAAGYGVTRAALNASDDPEVGSAGNLDPAASESPIGGGESPGAALPELPSPPPLAPPTGDVSAACSEVAVIMLTMAIAPVEEEDPDAYLDTVIDSRRTAADELREVTAADADEQASLDGLADEIDAAAQMVEDDPDSADAIQSSFDRVTEAYDTFNAEHCT